MLAASVTLLVASDHEQRAFLHPLDAARRCTGGVVNVARSRRRGIGGFLSSIFSNFTVVKTVINFLSVSQKYSEFTTGILDYANVIFFLSMQALFLFLTVRVLDSKRWN